MTNNRIVFFGSSDFSLKALVELCGACFDVIAVYTRTPKPSGRNYSIQKTAVHEFAESRHMNVYTPTTLRNPEQWEIFRSLSPDIAVVSSYGLIIPPNILDIPKYGFINIHASLLPRWRGASPIQSAILAGDKETGITIMKMDSGIDTGDIISMRSIAVTEKSNYGKINERLASLGAGMIIDTLNDLEHSLSRARKQPEQGAIYAAKISKVLCKIDWNDSAQNILRRIMAFSPVPSAWCEINGIRIKVLDAELVDMKKNCEIGAICDDFIIRCKAGSLKLTEVQPAGKKKMSGSDFMRGYASKLIRLS